MKYTLLIGISMGIIFCAQGQRVNFNTSLDWSQIRQKAAVSNKYIFVDCYATWCNPCKYLDKNIFSANESQEALNKDFVCYKMQADTTAGDIPALKSRRNETAIFYNLHKIEALPTLLVFSPGGDLVFKRAGSFEDVTAFKEFLSKVLDKDEQYFFLLDRYNSGEKKPHF